MSGAIYDIWRFRFRITKSPTKEFKPEIGFIFFFNSIDFPFNKILIKAHHLPHKESITCQLTKSLPPSVVLGTCWALYVNPLACGDLSDSALDSPLSLRFLLKAHKKYNKHIYLNGGIKWLPIKLHTPKSVTNVFVCFFFISLKNKIEARIFSSRHQKCFSY